MKFFVNINHKRFEGETCRSTQTYNTHDTTTSKEEHWYQIYTMHGTEVHIVYSLKIILAFYKIFLYVFIKNYFNLYFREKIDNLITYPRTYTKPYSYMHRSACYIKLLFVHHLVTYVFYFWISINLFDKLLNMYICAVRLLSLI